MLKVTTQELIDVWEFCIAAAMEANPHVSHSVATLMAKEMERYIMRDQDENISQS